MTIYAQPRSEIFASNAPPSEIQPFQAWLRGLGIAFDETNGFPEITGLNGLFNALNMYIKYLEQNGFAEWSSTLEYPIGAGVRVGAVWYRAKTQNTNKTPATSQNDWSVFLNAGDLSFGDPLQVVDGVIGVKDATTTQKGVTRFATATEVSNRTNVSAAITPANVGQTFGQSLSQNGWCRLPNGLIMQWGVTSHGDISYTTNIPVNFNTPFPVSVFSVTANEGGLQPCAINVINKSTIGFTAAVTEFDKNVQSGNINWFAIGY